jgi:hypothetical protein
MGGNYFTNQLSGKSMQDAYNKARENAEEEYGHQEGYSGEINSTYDCIDVTKLYKSSNKTLNAFIDSFSTEKGAAYCICLKPPVANDCKIKSKVEHVIQKGTKKWVLMYTVNDCDNIIGSKPTKGEAIKLARQHTEKTGKNTYISMGKKLEKGSPDVAKVVYKTSSKEKQGEYFFFGIAPC